MGPELLRRIRWGNVGKLAGALAVIAAVAAWPLLAPPEPALPGDAPRPLDGLPVPTATPPAELLVPRPPRAARTARGRARRSHAGKTREEPKEARARDGVREAAKRRARPVRVPPPVTGDARPRARPDDSGGGREDAAGGRGDDPAQMEFGFERD
ncbi:MAG TPA: hypothetical protein VFP78_12320 [Solirubrobacteraceae bacterium]|nr:hypothetical protein [Solirubrobacteraceae bacterium]